MSLQKLCMAIQSGEGSSPEIPGSSLVGVGLTSKGGEQPRLGRGANRIAV